MHGSARRDARRAPVRCVGTCGALDGRGVDRRARLEGAERPGRGLWPTPCLPVVVGDPVGVAS